MYFADGYKWPILDEVISWGLVDAVDPFEPLAHMDVAKFRKKYPDITVCQPIDCQNLLFTGTPAEIVEATTRAIEDAGARKIIIGSSSEVHPNIPVENAMAMGAGVIFVLAATAVIISALRSLIPQRVRIIAYSIIYNVVPAAII